MLNPQKLPSYKVYTSVEGYSKCYQRIYYKAFLALRQLFIVNLVSLQSAFKTPGLHWQLILPVIGSLASQDPAWQGP